MREPRGGETEPSLFICSVALLNNYGICERLGKTDIRTDPSTASGLQHVKVGMAIGVLMKIDRLWDKTLTSHNSRTSVVSLSTSQVSATDN
jgi:hypothetical protein